MIIRGKKAHLHDVIILKRMANHRHVLFGKYFAALNNPLSLKLTDKQAIEDELNIDGGKHVLACF